LAHGARNALYGSNGRVVGHDVLVSDWSFCGREDDQVYHGASFLAMTNLKNEMMKHDYSYAQDVRFWKNDATTCVSLMVCRRRHGNDDVYV
jgi:hypothetical protein